MSYPVAHVGSVVEVDGKLGKVITGAPAHNVGGSGGGGGGDGGPVAVLVESIGMETEDMSAPERRAYLNERFGEGSADGLERALAAEDTATESDPVNANDVASRVVGCDGVTNATSNSVKISRYFTVADASSGVYQPSLRHNIPNTTAKGLSRAATICNLKHVLINSIDPLKDWVAANLPGFSIKIGSGFRNKAGGSDHNSGSAIDLHFFKGGRRATRAELLTIARRIVTSANIPFTQFLLEYQGGSSQGWIHLANRRSGGNSALRVGYSMNGSTFHPNLPRSV
jgi:hypothetical protein